MKNLFKYKAGITLIAFTLICILNIGEVYSGCASLNDRPDWGHCNRQDINNKFCETSNKVSDCSITIRSPRTRKIRL